MTQAQQPEALRLAEQCDNFANRTAIATCLRAQHNRILELEGSVTHLENVYGAAIRKVVELEQGKCLHQIAEPAQDARTAFEAISRFMKCEWNLDWDPAGFYDDAKTDAAFTWFEQGYMRAQQAAALAEAHPDDAAVDALAALMKAKLAEKRAKGYGGWNDKAQCPQQRLSDMLRAHVDKGDPVDVANFCAMLSARGEGIAAAPQAVQAAEPEGWKLAPIKVPDSAFAWVSGGYPAGFKAGDKRDTAVVHERAQRTWEAILNGITAPAHPAEGVANEDDAFEKWWSTPHVWGLGHKAAQRSAFAAGVAHAAATQPAAQGMDAQQYRLIERGELIEAGDQFLRDDFTWQIDPRGIFVGVPHGAALRPARRALAAQAKQGGAA